MSNVEEHNEFNFEGNQNCLTTNFEKILRVFGDYNMWPSYWPHYVWTSEHHDVNFSFMNLAQSPAVWLFDIWLNMTRFTCLLLTEHLSLGECIQWIQWIY